MSTTITPPRSVRSSFASVGGAVERAVGGPARARVILILACVLGLESADLATVGAAGPQLESAFHISNSGLGLLAGISVFVGAVASVPLGALTDRVRRVNLLALAVALWALAMLFSAIAQSYDWLLLSRLALGGVTAAAGPAVASLTGDYFPAAERGKIYGYILTGELLGAGIGFVVSGSVAGSIGWRWAFGALMIPAIVLALAIWRRLPEPARGGQSHICAGDRRIVDAEEAEREDLHTRSEDEADIHTEGLAREAVLQKRLRPIRANVLHGDPGRMSIAQAVRYVLSIRTTRWIIIASSIGYFFFAGIRTFAVVFVRGHLALSQSAATAMLFVVGLGSLAGVLTAGRIADRMIRRGRVNARLVVGGISYAVATALLAPALLVSTVVLAGPLLVLAAAALAAPNPPMDAARLDIMPSRLWGRAEGVRTMLRQTAQAVAPLAFGILADALAGTNTSAQHVSAANTRGLQYAFLIMLVPLALNGLILLHARRDYPADVATAIASERQPATGNGRRRVS